MCPLRSEGFSKLTFECFIAPELVPELTDVLRVKLESMSQHSSSTFFYFSGRCILDHTHV